MIRLLNKKNTTSIPDDDPSTTVSYSHARCCIHKWIPSYLPCTPTVVWCDNVNMDNIFLLGLAPPPSRLPLFAAHNPRFCNGPIHFVNIHLWKYCPTALVPPIRDFYFCF